MKPERLSDLQNSGVTLLAPESVYIDDSVVLESGCVVHPFVFLRGNTVIGRNSTIQHGCEIEDSKLGETTFIKGFTRISRSSLGQGCNVGPYSDLRDCELGCHCQVGNYCLVRRCKLGNVVKLVSHCSLAYSIIEDEANLTGSITLSAIS
jgi:bifunctional UDP-N-acetylglucosamine pyrophosphorylase/glucosamine-1-phosphate N-acetyltransferase